MKLEGLRMRLSCRCIANNDIGDFVVTSYMYVYSVPFYSQLSHTNVDALKGCVDRVFLTN